MYVDISFVGRLNCEDTSKTFKIKTRSRVGCDDWTMDFSSYDILWWQRRVYGVIQSLRRTRTDNLIVILLYFLLYYNCSRLFIFKPIVSRTKNNNGTILKKTTRTLFIRISCARNRPIYHVGHVLILRTILLEDQSSIIIVIVH